MSYLKKTPNSWFHVYHNGYDSNLRLFCFPYAGGNAGIFSNWLKHLFSGVSIYALQAPGRNDRFLEPPINDINKLVDSIFLNIKGLLDKPYVFLGHSNGALVSFEVMKRIAGEGLKMPENIILSGSRAAHLPPRKVLCDLTDDELIEELNKLEATPKEILSCDEIMQILLPVLRADFSLRDKYQYIDGGRLEVDATIFWGNQDKEVSGKDVLAWEKHFSGNVTSVEFNSGHFFIHSNEGKYLSECNKVINTALKNSMAPSEV